MKKMKNIKELFVETSVSFKRAFNKSLIPVGSWDFFGKYDPNFEPDYRCMDWWSHNGSTNERILAEWAKRKIWADENAANHRHQEYLMEQHYY